MYTITKTFNLPLIVQMVEAYNKVGGPPKLVRQIINSKLSKQYNFEVVDYEISGFSWKSIYNLTKRLIATKPNVVHIHGLKNDGFHAVLAARLARVPNILLTVHGSTIDSVSDYTTLSMKFRWWFVAYILEPLEMRMADAVYCVCDAMKSNKRIQRNCNNRLLETIHNGIEPTSSISVNSNLRESFGLKRDDIVFIYTGRISADKGLFVLTDAIEKIMNDEDKIATPILIKDRLKFLIVGDGPEFENLKCRCKELIDREVFIMTGRSNSVENMLLISDVFVLPTFHENLSFSLLEAMRAGLPTIATAVGGNVEVVVDDQTGILVSPRKSTDLSDAIVDLALDVEKRNRMGLAGKVRVLNKFSVNEVLEKTGKIYHALLK